ncbi:glycosyltransferase [Cryobacterium frigoriphilum]|uniref:Glycosyltransferase n=1 Tax=Cryobacterium frigoriphilum TaxID=1259150 RepID=A0A4R9A2C1_9MICO|nr:glycosyltransferase [Cryobacterium frigoriphilum]TFD50807.1 glycosyltransferase [Cryobacterium frigoriphilum]
MRGVSVILPTVRLDAWLDEAVWSILGNTGVDVDLVVVHDGVVPDRTLRWATDPRVQLVHHPERLGQTRGMMSGLAVARHDLIARLDADDLSSGTRLSRQAAYLDAHPETVAVGSRVMRIDNAGVDGKEMVFPAGADIRSHLLFANVVAHSSLMFRRDVGRTVGGYDPTLRQMEDYDFILRLAAVGPIANLDELLTRYRVHPQQTSRGAPPCGHHIDQVMRGRVALRRALKAPLLASTIKNLVWRAVQFARYYRVIRPGYER